MQIEFCFTVREFATLKKYNGDTQAARRTPHLKGTCHG
jgi:hypothetical protein